jgi:hypothetical protein
METVSIRRTKALLEVALPTLQRHAKCMTPEEIAVICSGGSAATDEFRAVLEKANFEFPRVIERREDGRYVFRPVMTVPEIVSGVLRERLSGDCLHERLLRLMINVESPLSIESLAAKLKMNIKAVGAALRTIERAVPDCIEPVWVRGDMNPSWQIKKIGSTRTTTDEALEVVKHINIRKHNKKSEEFMKERKAKKAAVGTPSMIIVMENMRHEAKTANQMSLDLNMKHPSLSAKLSTLKVFADVKVLPPTEDQIGSGSRYQLVDKRSSSELYDIFCKFENMRHAHGGRENAVKELAKLYPIFIKQEETPKRKYIRKSSVSQGPKPIQESTESISSHGAINAMYMLGLSGVKHHMTMDVARKVVVISITLNGNSKDSVEIHKSIAETEPRNVSIVNLSKDSKLIDVTYPI